MVLSSYEASAILAPRSVYVEPNSTVSLLPFSVMVGGIVSTMMLELVRSSCVTLAAYLLEFVTEISNVRSPFVSL